MDQSIKIVPISFVPSNLIQPGMVVISPWFYDNYTIYIGNITSIFVKEDNKKYIAMLFTKASTASNGPIFFNIHKTYSSDIKSLTLTSLVCNKCKTLLSIRDKKYNYYFNERVREFERHLTHYYSIIDPILKMAKKDFDISKAEIPPVGVKVFDNGY